MKKAFTLIELLVVIAIIAILAAILFPVFAQAKLAAKQTANLSNQKNLGLAVIMYTNDFDDSFPLEQQIDPSDSTFFGETPWQITVQPYVKNWGVFIHPLGPNLPSSPPALVAWRQTLMYGAMAKAENSTPNSFYTATTAVGSFDRRVCGSIPCQYEGLFGTGCSDANGDTCSLYGGKSTVPSYTTTGIGNPSDALLVSEGAMWDLWSGFGISNICTYGVQWQPGQYNVTGSDASFSAACPAARKNPKPQADIPGNAPGSCTPSNLCDGVLNGGIPNGFTTYVASDGHAVSQDYRGRVMAQATLSTGVRVIKSMWPAGGF